MIQGQAGFIRLVAQSASYPSMLLGFFEWSVGSYPSLTQLAGSGGTTQAGLNTTENGAGTNRLGFTHVGSVIQIESNVASPGINLIVYITII
jgi:hypothetical protein